MLCEGREVGWGVSELTGDCSVYDCAVLELNRDRLITQLHLNIARFKRWSASFVPRAMGAPGWTSEPGCEQDWDVPKTCKTQYDTPFRSQKEE